MKYVIFLALIFANAAYADPCDDDCNTDACSAACDRVVFKSLGISRNKFRKMAFLVEDIGEKFSNFLVSEDASFLMVQGDIRGCDDDGRAFGFSGCPGRSGAGGREMSLIEAYRVKSAGKLKENWGFLIAVESPYCGMMLRTEDGRLLKIEEMIKIYVKNQRAQKLFVGLSCQNLGRQTFIGF